VISRKPLPSQEALRGLFDYEEGFLVRRTVGSNGKHKVGDVAGCLNQNGYYYVKIGSTEYKGHRLIWKWHHGTEPETLDHIDDDKSNNRIENLRPLTHRQNCSKAAQERRKTSNPPGVWARRNGRFTAMIQVDGKRRSLGTFDTPEQAHQAYMEALK
jgi:hypothetical protein